MIKKEPRIIREDNLKSALALQELNTNTESEECREMAKKLKHYYFGHITECLMPKMTYFLVKKNRIASTLSLCLFIRFTKLDIAR